MKIEITFNIPKGKKIRIKDRRGLWQNFSTPQLKSRAESMMAEYA